MCLEKKSRYITGSTENAAKTATGDISLQSLKKTGQDNDRKNIGVGSAGEDAGGSKLITK